VLNWLSGKKTYFISALGVAAAAYGYFTGTLDATQAITAALGAMGLSSLRAGIAKS
jgi:hypothetical protein